MDQPSNNDPPTDQNANPVRNQVRQHLRGILKAATAGILVQTASCGDSIPPPIVCDPLPPPINCSTGNTNLVPWTNAQWQQGSDGLVASVEVNVLENSQVEFPGPVTLDSGSVLSQAVHGTTLIFTFSPAPDATTVVASVPVQCSGGATASAQLVLNVSGPRLPGASIPVTGTPSQ